MRTIRNDTAALLQTVYLAEIGIQSLQDFEKGGVIGSASFSSLMPILGDETMENEEGTEPQGDVVGVASLGTDGSHFTEDLPPAKKRYFSSYLVTLVLMVRVVCFNRDLPYLTTLPQTLPTFDNIICLYFCSKLLGGGGGVAIVVCSSCGKRFANATASSSHTLCRDCREHSYTPEGLSALQDHASSVLAGSETERKTGTI